jgi:hypothetical protein
MAEPTFPDYGLPALRGSAAGESRIDPRLQPYLGMGLQRAEQLFFGQQPQFFPGQTYVDPSEQTLAALQQQEDLARGAQPTLTAAQDAYLSSLRATPTALPMYQDLYGAAGAQPGAGVFGQAASGQMVNPALAGFEQVAGGGFLSGSPYLEGLIQRATRPIAQQFTEQTLPGIASQFSGAGRYGSGAMARATGQAQEGASRAIGDIATNIAAQDYARERAFQEQARSGLAGLGQQAIQTQFLGASGLESAAQAAAQRQLSAAGGIAGTEQIARQQQLAAAGMAPQFYSQQFLPSQQLGQIGAAREQISAQPLQEQMQRFQFGQQVPYQQLQGFLSSVYGTPMTGSQIPATPQAQTNRLGQTLGGAILGSQLGGQFGGIGGLSGGQTGAILGGLGGLLL